MHKPAGGKRSAGALVCVCVCVCARGFAHFLVCSSTLFLGDPLLVRKTLELLPLNKAFAVLWALLCLRLNSAFLLHGLLSASEQFAYMQLQLWKVQIPSNHLGVDQKVRDIWGDH